MEMFTKPSLIFVQIKILQNMTFWKFVEVEYELNSIEN